MRKMEDLVLKSNEALAQSQEREKAMEVRMQEEIKKQVQLALSGQSEPILNMSPARTVEEQLCFHRGAKKSR